MTAINALCKKWGDKVAFLAFPCNQFGHQANEKDWEIQNTFRHVRPGNNWDIAPQVNFFSVTPVNGKKQHKIWAWLKAEIMIPCDEPIDSHKEGAGDHDVLIVERSGYDYTTVNLWSPVCRSDIAWNFEYFLLGAKSGKPIQRFGRYHGCEKIDTKGWIDKALSL